MNKEFLEQLRTATASQHAELEENDLSKNLMSPDVNHKSFLLYIERFYGFMIPFERCVVNILPNTLKSTERKSEWLLHDIKNAGAEPGMIELIDEHAFDDFATDKAKAIGAAYVLEGSTLGGVVINKHLQEKLRAEIPFESRFFKGYGLETGSSWRAFLENLSASVTEQNSTSIIEGAQTTFSLLNAWFRSAPNA